MSIREGGTTKINSLATKIKGLISTHEAKTGSSLQKGHVQAGGAPQTIGKNLSAGTDNGYYARADHVHTVDFSNILNKPNALDVIDNTTTNDGTKPLSAKQGKILSDEKIAYMGIDDNLDLYFGYDPITEITLTGNKTIFQIGQTATFTATVKNGTTLMKDIPVVFYDNDNYLITAVTNSNGVATYNYTGIGAGNLNIQARNGSVQSEPYTVIDAIVYDKAYPTSDDYNSDMWFGSPNWTINTDENGTTISTGTNTGYRLYTASSSGTSPYKDFTEDFAVEFILLEYTGTVIMRVGNDTSIDKYLSSLGVTSGDVVKLEVSSSNIKYYVNGEEIVAQRETYQSGASFFSFRINTGSLKYKDFKVYPI